MRHRNEQGIGLIEIVVYAGLLAVISVLLVNFLMQVINTYYIVRAEREVIGHGRSAIETVHKTITQAQSVYAPTSAFGTNAGQLSLVTAQGATAEHTTAYVDFWVENGQLWMRREGELPLALTGTSVNVTQFRLERIVQALGVQAVRTTLHIEYARPKFAASTTLYATSAIRGNY